MSMLQRIADVIRPYCGSGETGPYAGIDAAEDAQRAAREVLEAMAAPDEAMLLAGWGRAANLIEAHTSSRYVAEETWAAAFGAALGRNI